jgi:hypothetical protein
MTLDGRMAGQRAGIPFAAKAQGPPEANAAMGTDRRQHRRLRLQLPIRSLVDSGAGRAIRAIRTADVSPGGMFFHAVAEDSPAVGTRIAFELAVPPGEGYSHTAGAVLGAGHVVRTADLGENLVGVAVRFIQPPATAF